MQHRRRRTLSNELRSPQLPSMPREDVPLCRKGKSMNINDRTFNALQQHTFTAEQSENSALKYSINYSSVLQTATISASVWSSPSATIASDSTSGKTVTATISGAIGWHVITNKINTSTSETIERSIKLHICQNQGYTPGDYE